MSPNNHGDNVDLEYISHINYVIGGISFVTSVFLLTVQICIFIVLWKNREIIKSIPFQLIRHLGFTGFIQQLCHIISSIYTIFYYIPNNIIGKFIAALLQTAYMISITFLFILTLNRLDVIFNKNILRSINREKFFLISVISNYIWSLILLVFFMIPDFQLYFSLYDFGWQFVAVSPIWKIAQSFENKYVILILCFCFVTYIVIIGKIVQMRSYARNGTYFSLPEFGLLLQAIFSFLFIVFLELCWSFLYKYLPTSKYTFTVINYLYLLSSGINAVLSVIFIKELRLGVRKLICFGRYKKSIEAKKIKIVPIKTKT